MQLGLKQSVINIEVVMLAATNSIKWQEAG